MISIQQLKDDYNWREAFEFAEGFTIDDVVEIQHAIEGYNDGDDWIIWGRLRGAVHGDGPWFCLKAGCDYTGWDCRASRMSYVASTRKLLIQMGMDFGMRQRFGLKQPEEVCDGR